MFFAFQKKNYTSAMMTRKFSLTKNRPLKLILTLVVLGFFLMRHETGNTARLLRLDANNISTSQKYMSILQQHKIPQDYFERDFIDDNNLVNKLSPLLTTNEEVIDEARRIHTVMFKALIGRFKYAMLFGFAAIENKGDSAISVGELKIIKQLGIQLIFYSKTGGFLQDGMLDKAKNISGKYNTDDVVILLHGGGNLLIPSYANEDRIRLIVLETFSRHETVLFPQSISHNAYLESTRKYQRIFFNHERVTLLYRDRSSYILGKMFFPDVKSYLLPDMAFQIGAVERFISPTHDIMWIKRNDVESPNYEIPSRAAEYDVIAEDWWSWKTPLGRSQLENAALIAANGMMFLQRGRVVITDRLHGHILSVLCGIPHIVIDPVNKKTSSYMQSWTRGIENVVIADSAEDALDKALELLRKLDDTIPKKIIDS